MRLEDRRALERVPDEPADALDTLARFDGERAAQIAEAECDLFDDAAGDPPRWPYASLHAMLGAMAPGRVTVVGAGTGQGKTTLSLDLVDRLADEPSGRRVYVLGLEQRPKELRTKWACLRAGVPASVAFEKAWWDVDGGLDMRERVADEFRAQKRTRLGERVIFDPASHIDRRALRWAADHARAAGCEVLVIDHIDRVTHGPGQNPVHELTQTVELCTELADDYELHLVVFSQLNRDAGKGDRLAKYQPPQLHHLLGGSAKEREADVVLAVHRPLKFGVTREELAAVRAGEAEVRAVLEPYTSCVSCLKHRLRGSEAEGRWTYLTLSNGRLADMPQRDRYRTTAG